ncbi:MAG: GNAT family N-acetyltransferase [Armatimonas sp.]
MALMHLTNELIARAEQFSVGFHAGRMGAIANLPGNPFGVELRVLSNGIACKVRHPLLKGKNRIIGFRPDDLDSLDELLDFYREDKLRFSLFVPQGQMTPELFECFVQAGLWSAGSGTVPALVPGGDYTPSAPEIQVRRSEPEEKEAYLDLFQQAFDHRDERVPEYRPIQWAEDSLPGGARYIAEIEGKPVGMASFPVANGVGFMGTAGVLPEYRRRGVQKALIQRRLADAPALGCDLVLAGGSPGSTTYRNFERAGFRLIPTGSGWQER